MAKYIGIDANKVINPSTGILYRNPTHFNEAENADNQDDIINALKKADRARIKEVITYNEGNPRLMPGLVKILDMTRDEIEAMFRSLMRLRPNIFGIKIVLGDYPSAKQIETQEVRKLNISKKKTHTKIAEEMADLFGNKDLRVVAFFYTVHSSDSADFRVTAEAFGYTDPEELKDPKLFKPAVEITYFPNA